ncbi:glycosyltransferase family 2 protein [Dermatobacter hominis]|uniref:glycosyltransferase family 2 protein n=1 Tax=Dermatobacter hominis TaxID=2884263 RepID=UPI001D1068BF|nr:glycosyltransferase family 2 protein [Dermatobacter hominis]UDY36481.1 glycosyltransferase [Dermatobacter hominis]
MLTGPGGALRVVVVHWNQAEACLGTVARFGDREVPVRVTVVDNASEPDSLAVLRKGLDELRVGWATGPDGIELVEHPVNAGFGPGANVGLRRFLGDPDDGEWVALAPHDVDPHPGCLGAVLDAVAGQPMAGLACADVGDGMVPVIDPYFGGMAVPAPGPPPDPSHLPRWEDVDYPHGTLMFLRRATLDEVGVFDERYFSYCEEAELALRARRAGWTVGLVRGARVQNLHLGSSVARVDHLQTRNTLLLVQEMSGWYHAWIRSCITLWQVGRGLARPASRPPVFDAAARLRGLRDFWLRRFGPPPA